MWAKRALKELKHGFSDLKAEFAKILSGKGFSRFSIPVRSSFRRPSGFGWLIGGGILAAGLLIGISRQLRRASLPTADDVELSRYAGIWYEIARLPFREENGAVNIRATYTLLGDGRLEVLNECELDGFQGLHRELRGTARLADPNHPGRLKVRFGLISADYWILELGPSYEYAVVGEPGRRHLWILARKPQLRQDVFAGIVERMRERGFPTERLILAPQKVHSPLIPSNGHGDRAPKRRR